MTREWGRREERKNVILGESNNKIEMTKNTSQMCDDSRTKEVKRQGQLDGGEQHRSDEYIFSSIYPNV